MVLPEAILGIVDLTQEISEYPRYMDFRGKVKNTILISH